MSVFVEKKGDNGLNAKEHSRQEDDDEEDKPTGTVRPWSERLKVNRKLLPLKILMLLTHGGMAALYPYLTLHMRSIGLTFVEIGIIYAILPFVCAIGPAVGGAIADKLGNYKIVMISCVIMSIITHLLLWFAVPNLAAPVSITYVNVTSLNGTFPCGPQEIPHFLESDSIRSGCQADKGESALTVLDCSTDCLADPKPPTVCLAGHTDNYCLAWEDLSLRSFSGVKFGNSSASNKSITINTFEDQSGRNLTWITCVHRAACTMRCRIQTNLTLQCRSPNRASRVKPIALYVTFRFLAGIAVSTVIPVLDAIAYQMSEEYHGDLGIQRMFSLIGLCALPPLSGYLIGVASRQNGFADYSPAFYIFGAMNLISAIVIGCMSLSVRIPAVDILKNVGKILKNPKVFIFIVMMFLAGCAWGFLENYLFLFMKDIGSPEWLFGMTSTVSGLAAIPVVAASTQIMKYLGHTKILMLCFIFYGCRFLSYAYIYNPFHVLPVEVLEAITTSLLWVVASVYCGKIAPDYLATLQGVIGTMHYALGRGAGSLLGGLMFDYFKARLTYKIFAGCCFGIGIFYAILHYAWLRNIPSVEKEEEPKLTAGEPLVRALPSLRTQLSRKEKDEIVDAAKFAALTPLAMTFSGRSVTSSGRSETMSGERPVVQ